MKSAAETTRLPALLFDVLCVAILRVIAAITIQILASLLWLTSAWGAATRTETTRLSALRFDVVCVAILRVIAAITIHILASLLWLTSAWGWARAATRTETTRLPALVFDVLCVAILRVIAAITIQISTSLLRLTSAWGWAWAAARTETTRLPALIFDVLRVAVLRVVATIAIQISTSLLWLPSAWGCWRWDWPWSRRCGTETTCPLALVFDVLLVAVRLVGAAIAILIITSSIDHRLGEILIIRCIHELVLLAGALHLTEVAGDIVGTSVVSCLVHQNTSLVLFTLTHKHTAQIHIVLAILVNATILSGSVNAAVAARSPVHLV